MTSDNKILGIFRSHVLILLAKWLIILVVVTILLIGTMLFFSETSKVMMSFYVIILFLGSGMLVTSFSHWWINTDIVSSDRLVCIRLHGLFHYSVDTIPLRKVQSVDFRQEGLIQNIFGFGNIYISSELFGEPEKNIILHNISHHEKLVELLRVQSDSLYH